MEAQLFWLFYRVIHSIAHPPQRRVRYNDRIILLTYLWSVINDRPVCWACQRVNWHREPPFDLPSNSTLSKRLRTLGVLQLADRVLDKLGEEARVPWVKQTDSKPLTVGAYSKDSDAKRGCVAKGMLARGYRLHTLNHGRVPVCWTLSPMNDNDRIHAPKLLEKLQGWGYVVADNAYDCNDLYLICSQKGHQLLSPARVANKGIRDLNYNTPQRLRSLDMLDSPLRHCGMTPAFGQALYARREPIESSYGQLSMMGLNRLPDWVRRPHRVALWTAGKLACYLATVDQKITA